MVTFDESGQQQKISQLLRKEEEETVHMLSEKYHIPYADLSSIPINVDALALVPEKIAREAELAVIQKTGKKLEIGVQNPEHPKTKEALARLKRERFTWDLFLVSPSSLEKAWALYTSVAGRNKVIAGEVEVSSQRLSSFRSHVTTFEDISSLLSGAAEKRITDILEIILAGALELDASDVHLEPQEKTVRLRFRIDGVLEDAASLPPETYRFLLSRIKLIAKIKLNIQTRGQDGRFTIKLSGVDVEVRVSTLPGPYGENIVLRVLNPEAISVGFNGLGLQPWIEEIIARELAKPNGMILTTGPTGSGKTTTLYAFIRKVHTPETKIITLEDPIEYHIPGIEQTQVESAAGYDFASGLRSILRQDPDVILVGEIRDLETAQTAMHAALTGHLVFSTLHTNNVAGTIPRLLDLGVDPSIMAPAMNVAMAQRLVRKLCDACKEPYQPIGSEREEIEHALKGFPPGVPKPEGLGASTIFRARGCAACNGKGYRKRIGVFEILVIDEVAETTIATRPSEADVNRIARSQGQITMREDGILKVCAGITDLEEVNRVVGNE